MWAEAYLLKVDGHDLPFIDEPGALLHLHLVEQRRVDDGQVALQAQLQVPSLDVHHHILPLQTELHVERHYELVKDKNGHTKS